MPWAHRSQRMDEELEIIRGLAAGGYFEYHGKVFDVPPIKISPVPPLPILIGGHGDAALRRGPADVTRTEINGRTIMRNDQWAAV